MASASFPELVNNSPQEHHEFSRVAAWPRAWAALLVAAIANCAAQILWFWRFSFHNVNFDAISYAGIAHHIMDGDFRASLHGYWSPLISWLMAGVTLLTHDTIMAGHLVSAVSFLACLPVLYFLVLRLWNSTLFAAFAVCWFTMCRGVAAFSAYFIGADFLLTLCVLIYFILLLDCLRQSSTRNWALLGIPHAFAFLSKAIAMPWLTIATLAACSLSKRSAKQRLLYAAVAMAVPLLVWSSWGLGLKTRYGHFTPGYQLNWNLLSAETRDQMQRQSGELGFLSDTSQSYDRYTVVDSMYPGSALWQKKIDFRAALSLALRRALGNLPLGFKEFAILLTPGGVLSIFLALSIKPKQSTPEMRLLYVALLSAATLLLAYSPLVFDGARYVLPIIPVLMAVLIPFMWPGTFTPAALTIPGLPWRRITLGLLVIGTLFAQIYWASPLRSIRRDYQLSCYAAAAKLKAIPNCDRLAVIGSGPFPEHGVGWEAGIYASFLSGCRMVAFSPQIPNKSQEQLIQDDLTKADINAILVFDTPKDPDFTRLTANLARQFSTQPIIDPPIGQVGTLFWKTD